MENIDNTATKYLKSLSETELIQIAEDLQKPVLEADSPLRKATKEIFGEDSMMLRVGIGIPLCKVLADRIISLGENIDALNDAIQTYR